MREHNKGLIDWEEELSQDHKAVFDEIMIEALNSALPSCSKYLKAAKAAARQTVDKNGHIAWKNPLNQFPVVHKEFKSESRVISIFKDFNRIKLNIRTPTNKLDKLGMINATAPNCIHSLDSALLGLVEDQVDFDLACIHDSIGSNPSDTKKVVEAYSKAMGIMSRNNLFNMIFSQISDVTIEPTGTFEGDLGISKHALV